MDMMKRIERLQTAQRLLRQYENDLESMKEAVKAQKECVQKQREKVDNMVSKLDQEELDLE